MISRASLRRQFLISTDAHSVPAGWRQESLGGWVLSTHSHDGVPIIPILDRSDTQVGWLLGFAISLSGEFVQTKLQVSMDSSDSDFFRRIEACLYQYGGRWAAAIITEGGARFYLDPTGSLAAVYSPDQRIVASTAFLVPAADPPDADRELAELFDIPRKKSRFLPFGLTPRTSVHRLIPNHYLDMVTWSATRHWPMASSSDSSDSDTPALLKAIADAITITIDAVVGIRKTTMNLTAGYDSRMLLACGRRVVGKMQFQTHRIPYPFARFDCRVATSLAKRFRLNHRVNEWLDASEEELESWLFRTGHCLGGATWEGTRTFRQGRNADGVELNGLVAPVLKCKYWRDSDSSSDALPAPRELLSRWKIPNSPRIEAKCHHWLSSVSGLSSSEVLDLFYIEQRTGCWASVGHYGHETTWPLSPYNHRSILQSTMRIPGHRRSKCNLHAHIIESQWPELLAVPFNTPIGFDRLRMRLEAVSHSVRKRLKRFLI